MDQRKVLVVSGINFFEGGPLSVITDCLRYLNNSEYVMNYRIIALIHKKELFDQLIYSNIEFVEFPKSRKSYFYRLYYEYLYFKKFATQHKVDFWLSLHDMTPNLDNVSQAVYCHNASPFASVNLKDLYLQPTQVLFSLFYKFIYKINIHRNKFVIVQQLWIKEQFRKMFNIDLKRIIVAKPPAPKIPEEFLHNRSVREDKRFFFPTFPRPFKNIELICEAVKLLNSSCSSGFEVLITIDGTENNYSKGIYKKYFGLKNVTFTGLLKREEVYEIYNECDCLLFPSKLETWGLPISEFKQYNKPVLVADLPYARETVGRYSKAKFFSPSDVDQLAAFMKIIIENEIGNYDSTTPVIYPDPYAENWDKLFDILLREEEGNIVTEQKK